MSACDKNQNLASPGSGKLITALRVNELKSELEKRGLDSHGVKVVLTVRLNKALREEGFNPEQYVFHSNMSTTTENNMSTVEPSEGVKTDESLSSLDLQPSSTTEPEESQDLKIIDDSQEIQEHQKSLSNKDEAAKDEIQQPVVMIKQEEPEEKEQPVVAVVSEQKPQIQIKTEPVPENIVEKPVEPEEPEGEDEFEEIEEADETKTIEQNEAGNGPDQDEIFLDDEDLLEDPLDEQPLEENKKRAVSVASTVPTVVSSTNTSRAGTPAATNTGIPSKTALFDNDTKKTSIWIRGIAPATKASTVKQLASQFGKVIQAKIFNSKPIKGEIKNCFALVTFADAEAMEAANTALHAKDHEGRTLRVEKVAESHLTGSAERQAKEKKDAEDKKRQEQEAAELQKQQERKKRAVIQAPEDTKRKERQTIQAPQEKKNNRAVIQAPERDDRRKEEEKERARKDRKPIVYKMSPGAPAALISEDKRRGGSSERDTRRTISAAAPRRAVSPIRHTSRAARGEPSLIISARVDTRGGVQKRSVERHVPNNITTSQLRRNQVHVPARHSPPRASYQTQQYANAREMKESRGKNVRGGQVRDARSDIQAYHSEQQDRHRGASGDRRNVKEVASYRQEPVVRHSSSSSNSAAPRYKDSSRQRRDDSRHQDQPTAREREMIEMLKRRDEEHRIREEKLELQREREKMKFEAEKLERAKLEVELSQQRLALQQALHAESRARGGDTARTFTAMVTGSSSSGSSRRRPADHLSPPARPAKVHVDDRNNSSYRSGSSRSGSGRHSGTTTATSGIPSARHVATAYGIQASGGNTISGSSTTHRGSSNVYSGSTTKDYDHRDSYRSAGQQATAAVSYDSTSSIGGYQSGYSAGYGTGGYQSHVWNSYDSTGQPIQQSGTNWTGTASASSSATSTAGHSQWQQPQSTSYQPSSSTTSSSARHQRDYNNYSGRSNY